MEKNADFDIKSQTFANITESANRKVDEQTCVCSPRYIVLFLLLVSFFRSAGDGSEVIAAPLLRYLRYYGIIDLRAQPMKTCCANFESE